MKTVSKQEKWMVAQNSSVRMKYAESDISRSERKKDAETTATRVTRAK